MGNKLDQQERLKNSELINTIINQFKFEFPNERDTSDIKNLPIVIQKNGEIISADYYDVQINRNSMYNNYSININWSDNNFENNRKLGLYSIIYSDFNKMKFNQEYGKLIISIDNDVVLTIFLEPDFLKIK